MNKTASKTMKFDGFCSDFREKSDNGGHATAILASTIDYNARCRSFQSKRKLKTSSKWTTAVEIR
jgi:hypothetical protein